MKVVGYIRVSTDEQSASGLGLESQESKIRQYAKLYDLELVEILHDAASGKNLRRPGLQTALSVLEQGKAAGLVIAKLDRLTRSVRNMGELLEVYFNGKFSLRVVAEQIDTSTAAGRMMLNILISVAQWERETISERTVDALRAKRKRGEKTGGSIPFGYDFVDGTLVENAREQRIIRLMESLRAEGHSYQRIANTLNEDGHLTKTGRAWTWKLVRKTYLRAANE
jgi:DNA invertase Pin-like site-specific DNA recombinase